MLFQSLSKDTILLIDQYLDNLKRLNKSPHTILNYRGDLIKFGIWIEHHEKKPLQKITADEIFKYIQFLTDGGPVFKQEKENYFIELWKKLKRPSRLPELILNQGGMSVSSKKRHLSGIKNFYQYLKETHEDTSKKFAINPIKSKLHNLQLRDIDVQSTKLLTKEQFKIIDEAIHRPEERLILYLLYYGGLRISELKFLKYKYFDKANFSLTFPRKGGSIHQLFIQNGPVIFQKLNDYNEIKTQKWKMDFNVEDYIFCRKNGKPQSLKTIHNKIKKIIYRPPNMPPQLSAHSLRKACATYLYLKTKDLLLVRDYLNHSDAAVTQMYIDKTALILERKKYK